jgi:hypothetical protein
MQVFAHPFRWLSTQPACLPAKMSSSYNDLLRAFQIGESQYDDVCLRLESTQVVAEKAGRELEFAQETITRLQESNERMLEHIRFQNRMYDRQVVSHDNMMPTYKPDKTSNADQGAIDEIKALKKERVTLHKKLANVQAEKDVLLIDMNNPVDQRVYEDVIKKQRASWLFERHACIAAAVFFFIIKNAELFFYECHRRQ